jgi:hypothetical protein
LAELSDYYDGMRADIRREADAAGILMVEAFFDRMTEKLVGAGELEVADRAFHQSGEGGQRIRIDGYGGDPRDSDGILSLIVCDFVDADEVQSFNKAGLTALVNPLIRFLNQARTESFRDGLNEASPAFQVSDLLVATWSKVEKVKLILVSNRRYAGKGDAVSLASIGHVPITYSVWDLERFERFDRAGQTREDMVIDFEADFGGSLPALRASQEDAALESYLMIVPGEQLARIYDKWGARLLEANVRSFLQARAKTNKGIQSTIKNEPSLFFPYNNGLSATADAVTCVQTSTGLAVASISNFQIVNGAQTTGSIHSALKASKEQLQHVFVQMKLTVVPPERSEEIVPKISEFANTQNKVNAADFFSNHPFHVRIEQFSRDILFAAKAGERHDSKWFYERSRGQYINARSKLTTAQQKKFDLEFPKSQLFAKTDLAKFEFSAAGNPHLVSRGAQKNFAEFAKEIGDAWTRSASKYDEVWYKRLIAKAIIFKFLETEVPKQQWYEGGYRANIVTYAMAKLFHDAQADGQVLDEDVIWRKQLVGEALGKALLLAAEAAHNAITQPPQGVRNMSEWAKQQACWSVLKGRQLSYDVDFDTCLILEEESRLATRETKTRKNATKAIEAQAKVVELGAEFWRGILDWGREKKCLTPNEMLALEICTMMPRRLPNEIHAKHATSVLERARLEGVA